MKAQHDLPIQIRFVCFVSRKFDLEAEPENDINPIHGQSFLAWLRPRLEGLGYTVDGPDTEDWGWYLDVRGPTAGYIVGASALEFDEGVDWTIQLSRQRSFREWITGKGWITREDPLVRLVERIVREETEATEVCYEELLYAGLWRSPPHRSMPSPEGG